jgi:hypothetical protein
MEPTHGWFLMFRATFRGSLKAVGPGSLETMIGTTSAGVIITTDRSMCKSVGKGAQKSGRRRPWIEEPHI